MHRLAKLCFVLALPMALALAACSNNTNEAQVENAAEANAAGDAAVATAAPVIVMLGDSLTAGFELPSGAALPAAVQRDLDARGIAAKVVNAGVSGDTTADGLNRYDWSVKGSNASLLVIALGGNDFLNDLPASIPKENLAKILDKAKADNIPAVLLGVAIPEGAQPNNPREAEYAAIYPELAQTYGVPYFPDMLGPIAGNSALVMSDGLHPTAEGVEAMAAAIADFLAPLMEDLG